jgi:raffinose/stachyose/melibiose transport system permease protein
MKIERIIKPLLFLAPAIIIYAYIMIFPMAYSLYMSLYQTTALSGGTYVGLNNYKTLFFDDPIIWVSIKNNLIWLVLALVIPLWLGLFAAVVLNREFKGRIAYRSLIYYPSVLSLTAVGLIWGWLYHPQLGLFNVFFQKIGLPFLAQTWLGDPRTAFFSIFVSDTWISVGFAMVMFLGGMQSIPLELYECARVEGASPAHIFVRITIPLLRETFLVITTLYMIGSFKIFDIIFTMTAGGPARSTWVLALAMYMNAFKFYKMGYGSAVSWTILLFVAIIVIPYVLFMSREKHSYM